MAQLDKGPVSVAIQANKLCFQMYKGGVLNNSKCGTKLDHGVLAVGYGTDATAGPYYIVKNSWGATWGEEGYIRLANNDATGPGMCGLQSEPSQPTCN